MTPRSAGQSIMWPIFEIEHQYYLFYHTGTTRRIHSLQSIVMGPGEICHCVYKTVHRDLTRITVIFWVDGMALNNHCLLKDIVKRDILKSPAGRAAIPMMENTEILFFLGGQYYYITRYYMVAIGNTFCISQFSFFLPVVTLCFLVVTQFIKCFIWSFLWKYWVQERPVYHQNTRLGFCTSQQ